MLITVARFTEHWEAHLFRGRLDAEGLFAIIAHEHHVWNNWPYALALGGVKVQVLPSEHDAALDVLARCRAGGYRAELEAEFGPLDELRCPNCGAAEVASRRAVPWVVLLVATYLVISHLVIFPLRRVVHRCQTCGTKWTDSLSIGKGVSLAVAIGLLLVAFYV